jgi:hypothetical protein
LLVVYDDMKLAERRHGGGEGSDRRVSVEHWTEPQNNGKKMAARQTGDACSPASHSMPSILMKRAHENAQRIPTTFLSR